MQDRLEYLLEQYINQSASQEEENELFEIVGEHSHKKDIKKVLLEKLVTEEPRTELDKERWSPVLRRVLNQEINNNSTRDKSTVKIDMHRVNRRIYLKRWLVAASMLLFFSSGWYFLSNRNPTSSRIAETHENSRQTNDVPPGRSQAILTLSDGSIINLDSAKSGTLTRQGNIKIVKGEDGQLLYYVEKENFEVAGDNIISTPRGGKYEIVLCDGSKVWLNAASSLKFPAAFKGRIREVILTGEGYFEVAKNASMPFHVTVNDMTVEVLGTHFNVNAYVDENSVATTLLEGSVKVTQGAAGNSEPKSVLLKPGEQAKIKKDGRLRINRKANIEEVIAWKEDIFEFTNATIPMIMRQVSRWYDVEIDYRGAIPERRFTGKFSRNVSLSQLIEMLQYTGVNMKIENKKIIIWESETISQTVKK